MMMTMTFVGDVISADVDNDGGGGDDDKNDDGDDDDDNDNNTYEYDDNGGFLRYMQHGTNSMEHSPY
jgi:hypothetical protein